MDPDNKGKFPEGTAIEDGGVRISPSNLKARSAPTSPSVPASMGETIAQGEVPFEKQSFGAYSTPNTPFSGPTSNLMPAQAAAALFLMGAAIGKIEESIFKAAKGKKSNLGNGPYMKGENSQNAYSDPKLRLLRNLLLVPTQRSYEECVKFGTEIIFGKFDYATLRDNEKNNQHKRLMQTCPNQ